ncbi:MAG: hypothetical protein H0W88_11560 [Parachlamydiaceae bacterium]|nr:hypothetical protein [Parachlamydiaceae bacterium]
MIPAMMIGVMVLTVNHSDDLKLKFNKLSKEQKIVTVVALTIFLAISTTFLLLQNMHRFYTYKKPDFQGSLKGKIAYDNYVIDLAIEGKDLKLDQNGLFSGHAKVTEMGGHIAYDGLFEKSVFKKGTLTTYFYETTCVFDVDNFKIVSGKNTTGLIEKPILDIATTERQLKDYTKLMSYTRFPMTPSIYHYEGSINAWASLWDRKTAFIESDHIKIDEKGRIIGKFVRRHDDEHHYSTFDTKNGNFELMMLKA